MQPHELEKVTSAGPDEHWIIRYATWILVALLALGLVVVSGVLLSILTADDLPATGDPGLARALEVAESHDAQRDVFLKVAFGIVAAGAGVLAWAKHEQTRREYRRLEFAQLNDRFSRAVEMTASSLDSVRLGGLFMLEQLALDAPATHTEAVVEMLGAYVRSHGNDPDNPLISAPMSTMTALLILSRNWDDWGERRPRSPVRDGATFSSGGAMGDFLYRSGPRGVNLHGVDLRSAVLPMFMNLTGADLGEADLDAVRAPGARLRLAYLGHARAANADFNSAIFEGATLVSADFTRADLRSANLIGVRANHVVLTRARLEGIIADRAELSGATLIGASLAGATLSGADLRGADLSGVSGIDTAQLQGVVHNHQTKWPDGFQPPSAPA